MAIKDEYVLAKNYTVLTSVLVPLIATQEDLITVEQKKLIVQLGLILSLVVPMVLMILFESNIGQIFGLYL